MPAELERIHVIYDRPLDWPVHVVVRAWRDGFAERGAIAFASLSEARQHCQRLGLVCFEKDPASDPVIVEVWAPIRTEWPFGMKAVSHG